MNASENAVAGLRTTVGELPAHVGRRLGHTHWRTVTQGQVDAFADLTDDHNPIHVDPARASASPFGTTIVHGFFTVALLAPMIGELLSVEDASLSVNYGIDKIRFPSPTPVGAQFRCTADLAEVTAIDGGVRIKVRAVVEVMDAPKPALVAECLFHHYA